VRIFTFGNNSIERSFLTTEIVESQCDHDGLNHVRNLVFSLNTVFRIYWSAIEKETSACK
jgi:hypothetical protein